MAGAFEAVQGEVVVVPVASGRVQRFEGTEAEPPTNDAAIRVAVSTAGTLSGSTRRR
ncbi:hypothetical protein [Streptomyces niveus]|uniref:hypothetical protein n=1 Tax=Streptomyces niveus TaxID=193462 RepID=UPI0034147E58